MGSMIAGHATAAGTTRYVERFAGRVPAEHFRELAGGARVSSIGIGTYLGREDAATDALYHRAIGRALERGVNVLDTAVNYRHQRSERAIGAAVAAAVRGGLGRDEIVVATKGGFIPFDAEVPSDPGAYFQATYVRPGIIQPGEVVGSHCMTPRYLRDQIDRSRATERGACWKASVAAPHPFTVATYSRSSRITRLPGRIADRLSSRTPSTGSPRGRPDRRHRRSGT